jgi:hypothetical protein
MLLHPSACCTGSARALLAPRRGPGRVRWSSTARAAPQLGDRTHGELPAGIGCARPAAGTDATPTRVPLCPTRSSVGRCGPAADSRRGRRIRRAGHLLAPAGALLDPQPPQRCAACAARQPLQHLERAPPPAPAPQDQAAGAHPGRPVQLELLDAAGLGGGGSGAAAGLLHPYTAKGRVRGRAAGRHDTGCWLNGPSSSRPLRTDRPGALLRRSCCGGAWRRRGRRCCCCRWPRRRRSRVSRAAAPRPRPRPGGGG